MISSIIINMQDILFNSTTNLVQLKYAIYPILTDQMETLMLVVIRCQNMILPDFRGFNKQFEIVSEEINSEGFEICRSQMHWK